MAKLTPKIHAFESKSALSFRITDDSNQVDEDYLVGFDIQGKALGKFTKKDIAKISLMCKIILERSDEPKSKIILPKNGSRIVTI